MCNEELKRFKRARILWFLFQSLEEIVEIYCLDENYSNVTCNFSNRYYFGYTRRCTEIQGAKPRCDKRWRIFLFKLPNMKIKY